MNPPALQTMALGHPAFAYPTLGIALYAGYASYQDLSNLLWAIPAFLVLNKVAHASRRRSDYLSWKATWEGMGGARQSSVPTKSRPWMRWLAYAVTAATLAVLWADPETRYAFYYMAICLIGAMAIKRLGKRRDRRKAVAATKMTPVVICIKGPLIRVPRLRKAYEMVPAYCKPLLQAQQ